jgi:Viral BACON domain
MKVLKSNREIERPHCMKNRTSRVKHTVRVVLAVICLTSGLALPGYCWNQQVSSRSAIAPAMNSGRNNIGILGQGTLNAWRSNGPAEEIRSLAVDPSNPNIIYAASRSGVFKSADGGATWTNIGLRDVLALVIDFVDPNNLYAGTRFFQSSIVFAPGDRFLFKSTDGGTTWSNSSSPVDWDMSLLVMDPTSPKVLYAGSSDTYWEQGGIVLQKSTDSGATWNGFATGIASFGWAINPANPETIYAPSENNGLFKSTDGGANWSATGLSNTSVSAVAIDPLNPDTLYAGTTDYYSPRGVVPFLGLFKSTDGGDSWFAINNGLSDLFGNVSIITAVAIDPDDPNILYAGTSGRGVFSSADGGASWSEVNLGLNNLSINALTIDPLGKHLYAATDFGVFDFHYATPCADPLSPANQAFDTSGGTGFVNVTADSECSWTAASNANWISVTSDRSGRGSGTVRYSVAPNETTATAPRKGIIGIGARFLTVTQAGAPVKINNATVSGKKLFVTGENFDAGAVILLNGEEQKTGNDVQNPTTTLIGKKAGKKLKPGDKLQVRNPNGSLSQQFTFTGS